MNLKKNKKKQKELAFLMVILIIIGFGIPARAIMNTLFVEDQFSNPLKVIKRRETEQNLRVEEIFSKIQTPIIMQQKILTKSYNYSGISNPSTKNYAENYTVNGAMNRWASGTELFTAYYTNLATVNLQNATCKTAGTNDYCFLKFIFPLNESAESIIYTNLTMIGGETGDDVGDIVIYNWTNGVWVDWGADLPTTYGTRTFNLTEALAQAVVGSTGNNLTIIVDDPAATNDATEYIRVDYIEAKVTYTDNEPKWYNNMTNSTYVSQTVKHSVNWTDDFNLAGYIFSFDNGGGSFSNDTWVAMTGKSAWSNVSKDLGASEGATIKWRIYANDSSNNWNVTDTFQYTTTAAPTNCWGYNEALHILYIPSGCEYYIPFGSFGYIA